MSFSHSAPSFDISSYPQVTVRSLDNDERKGRGLFASTAFEPGQLILKERPILHTAYPEARAFTPTSDLEIPYDWQRLLYLYAFYRTHNLQSGVLDGILTELSVDGVCSDLARDADPDREREFREWADDWVEWYNAQNASSQWRPTSEEMFRLIAILETNSHSRDEDDMRDLRDPRTDAADTTNVAMFSNLPVPGEEEEEEEIKDEACGLWVIASMLNHSCLPNCTVFIPPTKRSGAEPMLYLRCIRPVAAGDELLVSYHDEEFLPTLDRRAMLMPRGFECHCALCEGAVREYMRGAVCPGPGCDGICCPVKVGGQMGWVCHLCNGVLSDRQVSDLEAKEEQWMSEWEHILAMTLGDTPTDQCTHLLAYQVLNHYSQPFPPPSQPLPCPPPSFLSPMHPTHSHIYTFLKFILFENSVWLRQHFGDDGVRGVLRAMLSAVQTALGSLNDGGNSVNVSEERRVLGYWVVKEAERQLGRVASVDDRMRWESIREEGLVIWQVGMRYLCSTD
ncbi:SET domain-containing protein [Heliocybe sulcata]|uniref:SET domain-containing protein n=1 Tax=Heliocybe sulcata TaxID=5364 RepID=A0A5C3MUJ1_9AGAM|nr:SET domain-containing protein [Heliocybe sulcata]